MATITAIYGSPRRAGNTSTLLREAVAGARHAGAEVNEYVLRDLKMSPCLEIYGCKKGGDCVIKDDFAGIRDAMVAADGLVLASPIFFYTVSAHMKILMDRCQSLWVKKYWLDTPDDRAAAVKRPALVILAGATSGKRLFDGALLTMRYFLDVLDADIWKALTYRGLDHQGDVLSHPRWLAEAREAGANLAAAAGHAGQSP